MVEHYSTRAIERFVRESETPHSGLTVYFLHEGCTREQRLAVLAELRALFPDATISAIGDEIACFGGHGG